MSDVVDRLTALVHGFDARVQAAPGDSWSNQSPCADWDARGVVEHVANNFLRLGGVMTGSELAPTGADESAPDAWARAKSALLDNLAGADLSTTVPGPMGMQMPLEQLLGRFVANDVLVHTWDLARSVGGDERLPEDVVAQAFSGLKPLDAMIRQPGIFGDKADCADDADIQTQFLSFLGRAV
jgi:uncharacterized protein (TIGR03086 family)